MKSGVFCWRSFARICKYRKPAYDIDHQVIDTCRLHVPAGCSWGDCNEAECPILKEWKRERDGKNDNVDAFEEAE